jgi:hypothetical protein
MKRSKPHSQSNIVALSILGLDALVRMDIFHVPRQIPCVSVRPYLWCPVTADSKGAWSAKGWAQIDGVLPEPLTLVIWCCETDSFEPLDIETESDYLIDAVSEQVVPILKRAIEPVEVKLKDVEVVQHPNVLLI